MTQPTRPSIRVLLLCLAVFATDRSEARGAEDVPVVRLVRLDGGVQDARLVEFSEDGMSLVADGRSMPVDDLRRIESVAEAARTAAPAHDSGIELLLNRGGSMTAADVRIQDEVCTATLHDGTVWKLSLGDLRSFRRLDSPAAQGFAAAVHGGKHPRDMLFVQAGEVATVIEGFIETVVADAVAFEWMNESRTLPRERVYAVVFSSEGAAERSPPRFTIELHDGSRIPADRISLSSVASGSETELVLSAGISPTTRVAIPWSGIRTIGVRSSRLRFLSDLDPSETTDAPIAALPRGWQRDRSVTGSPLRAGELVCEKGIGMQSGSKLVFDLEGEWTEFAAVLALAPEARDGDCLFVVRGDDEELLRERVRSGDAPRPVRVDVEGIRRLELSVEYGENLDFGDHANWCDACLVRPRR